MELKKLTDFDGNDIAIVGTTKSIFIDGTNNTIHNAITSINSEKIEIKIVDEIKNLISGGSAQGITIVNNYLLKTSASNDEHTDTANINCIALDSTTLPSVYTITHNLGHLNTIDYNENNDCLLISNGSKSYSNLPKGWIIKNLNGYFTNGSIDFNSVDKIELDFTHLLGETKAQLCWGDNLQGRNNIIYLVTNDNKKIRKYRLGIGNIALDGGNFIEGTTGNDYNGTYTLIDEWSTNVNIGVNGDTLYYKGALYTAGRFEDKTLGLYKLKLNSDSTISHSIIKIPVDVLTTNDFGAYHNTYWSCDGQGVARKGNDLYVASDYYIAKLDVKELD